MFKFLFKPATLADIASHVGRAEGFKQLQQDALNDALDAIAEHNTAGQQTIQGLSASIGQISANIDVANAHAAKIQATLALP
jgi:hypothetical protein